MNREEAANILDLKTRPEALADFVGPELAGIVHQAMIMGAEALRSHWVKTADRPPTHKDASLREKVLARGRDNGVAMAHYAHVRDFPNVYPWWMPIPELPEVEEQEPYPGDDLDCPNCGAMLELVDGKMLECPLCGFSDNDTAEVEE